jgi:DNA processing protein
MARGIDTAAHLGSLKTGIIAVLANGVGIPYPRKNAALFSQLIKEGVVLSEMRFITQPSPKLFPIRNRIIASLAKDELIIEAAVKSGALITAQEAANRSIDVMAIPGSPLDPRSAGTNSLIKDGAALVQNAQDVLAVLTSKTEVRMPDITAYTKAETFL